MTGPFAKDCGCPCHEGPHWLYMDELLHEMNQKHLERAREQDAAGNYYGAWLTLVGHAQEELVRLREKRLMMERYKIDRIPDEMIKLVRASMASYRAKEQRKRARDRKKAIATAESKCEEVQSPTPDPHQEPTR